MPGNGSPENLIDEPTLLAWIEGELGREPALRERVERMRADREHLRAMPDESAPAGLIAGAADMLEREMLVGAPEPGEESVSPSLPTRGGRARPGSGSEQSGSRRLVALAASLLLVAGAAGFLASRIADQTGPTGTRPLDGSSPASIAGGRGAYEGPTIAGADREATTRDLASTKDQVGGEPIAAAERSVAPTERAPDSGDPVGEAERVQELAAGDDSGTDAASSAAHADASDESAGPASEPRVARLARLAAEGRLIVRVRTRLPDSTIRRVQRIGLAKGTVRVTGDVPTALAGAIKPTPSTEYPRRELIDPVLANALEGDDPAGSLRGIEPEEGEPVIAGLYLMELDLDAKTLQRAIEALSAPVGQEAEFEVLDRSPLEGRGLTPPTSNRRLLWWTGEPSEWVPRGHLPIVVETLDRAAD